MELDSQNFKRPVKGFDFFHVGAYSIKFRLNLVTFDVKISIDEISLVYIFFA
jgi:hypothetical protein